MANSFVKKLQNFFNFTTTSDKQTPIVPTTKDPDTGKYRKVKGNSYFKDLWAWWLHENYDTSETLKGRFDRYDDLEFMVYNEPVIAMAAELYADEATQADSDSQIFQIQASDKKVEKEIKRLLKKWGFTKNKVREIAYNVVLYGDHFNVNAIDDTKGFTEAVALDPKDVKDRIEFKLSDVAEAQIGDRKLISLANTDKRLQMIYDVITQRTSKEDTADMFKSYLFGFQISDNLFLPPWNVSHFRLFTSKSEFWPYGRSMFIFSIAPFRQLTATKNMMALARAYKFPKEHFQVTVDENMDQTEIWEAVNEAREEYQNIGVNSIEKEDFAVGSQIWTPADLLRYDTIQNNISVDDIADVELLRDDLIMGTRIPKGYLVVDRSSFGTSGQALLQQFKPFGRAVYYVQSAILEELTNMLRMHFLITDQFDKEYTKFEISMNFPVVEESSDRLRMKNDTLRLAKDVLDNIQSALGTRDGLPPEVIKAVFSQLSFLEPDDVDKWVDISVKSLEEPADNENGGGAFFDQTINNSLKESEIREMLSHLSEDIILESYFSALHENEIVEYVASGRHHMTSFHITSQQEAVYTSLRRLKQNSRLEE